MCLSKGNGPWGCYTTHINVCYITTIDQCVYLKLIFALTSINDGGWGRFNFIMVANLLPSPITNSFYVVCAHKLYLATVHVDTFDSSQSSILFHG